MDWLATAAARLLGGVVQRTDFLAGGDISQVMRVLLADGREVVAKGGAAPRVEADMLEAIAATGAPAPRVLAVDDSVLVLEALPAGGSLARAWGSLGGILARLHAATGDSYGWPTDYALGAVRVENAPCDDWAEFWARRRLSPQVPHVAASVRSRIEILAGRVGEFLPRRPPACLLHGDLWGGNVLVKDGHVSGLIDPACYYGHGEVDVAMLGLFDRPDAAFFSAYGALQAGSETRLAVYRLWPALVHLRLFGTGYLPMVERLLRQVGA